MTMRIDQLQPDYDARLLRHADVPQPPAVVRQAMEAVTFADLPTLSLLGRVRSFGRRGQRNPEPIFSGMRHADFVHVEENDDEIAAAMAGTLWRIRKPFVPLPNRDRVLHPDPCWAVTVSSYRIEPRDAGSRFVCETRVTHPSDPRCARKFRPYWTLIGRLGATVYARDLVAAIRRRSVGQPRR
jgi:hypothetical protein